MNLSKEHQKKFAEFLKALELAKEVEVMVIHHPAVLGDNYEELITNLDLLAEAELKLVIVPPTQRAKN